MQPRRVFEEDRLQELAQSIKANGIIQPLVVRRQVEVATGRWRAAAARGQTGGRGVGAGGHPGDS